MSLEEIVRRSTSRAEVVRVRNALNPLLWLSAVAPPLTWLAASAFRSNELLEYALVLAGCLPILATLAAYFIWMFRDPNRLQSEEFVLRQHELSLLERKGQLPAEIPGAAAGSQDAALPPHEDSMGMKS